MAKKQKKTPAEFVESFHVQPFGGTLVERDCTLVFVRVFHKGKWRRKYIHIHKSGEVFTETTDA